MNDAQLERRATFSRMDQGSKEDWAVISAHNGEFSRGLADRVLEHEEPAFTSLCHAQVNGKCQVPDGVPHLALPLVRIHPVVVD